MVSIVLITINFNKCVLFFRKQTMEVLGVAWIVVKRIKNVFYEKDHHINECDDTSL